MLRRKDRVFVKNVCLGGCGGFGLGGGVGGGGYLRRFGFRSCFFTVSCLACGIFLVV